MSQKAILRHSDVFGDRPPAGRRLGHKPLQDRFRFTLAPALYERLRLRHNIFRYIVSHDHASFLSRRKDPSPLPWLHPTAPATQVLQPFLGGIFNLAFDCSSQATPATARTRRCCVLVTDSPPYCTCSITSSGIIAGPIESRASTRPGSNISPNRLKKTFLSFTEAKRCPAHSLR